MAKLDGFDIQASLTKAFYEYIIYPSDEIIKHLDFQAPLLISFYDYIVYPSDVYNRELFLSFYTYLTKFFISLIEAINASFYLLIHLLVLLVKLITLAIPHLVEVSKAVIKFHATQLTIFEIFIEITILTFLTFFMIYRERISNLWKRVEHSISQKSKRAAKLAPHILFFSVSLLLSVFGQKFLRPLSSSTSLPIFTLLFPFLKTVRSLYYSSILQYKSILSLWSILGIYHAFITAFEPIPIFFQISNHIPFLRELTLVVSIWVQASPVCTEIVHSNIDPLLGKVIDNIIPLARIGEKGTGVLQPVIYALKVVRIINDSGEQFIKSLLQDTAFIFVTFFCLLIPHPFSSFGLGLVCFILPAYKSSIIVNANVTFYPKSPSETKAYKDGMLTPSYSKSKSSAKTPSTPLAYNKSETNNKSPFSILSPFSGFFSPASNKDITKTPSGMNELNKYSYLSEKRWLEYWIVISVLWGLRICNNNNIPFQNTIYLILSLYLQHSYFQGATDIIGFIAKEYRKLVDRNLRMQKAKLVKMESESSTLKIE